MTTTDDEAGGFDTVNDEAMADLLAARSQSRCIGQERGRCPADGVAVLIATHGASERLLWREDGQSLGVVQLVWLDAAHGADLDGERASGWAIANLYVRRDARRRGIARRLLARAERRHGRLAAANPPSRPRRSRRRPRSAWTLSVVHARRGR